MGATPSATATASTGTESRRTDTLPRTTTFTRDGANSSPPGNVTSAGRRCAPFARPIVTAAPRARSRYSASLRWYGFGRPSIIAGSNSRSRSSFIDRAADSAARSAARCARPLPASALPRENSTDAPSINANSAPSATISAWPRSGSVRFASAAVILAAAEATGTGVKCQRVTVTKGEPE
jgi:hypothetical protein